MRRIRGHMTELPFQRGRSVAVHRTQRRARRGPRQQPAQVRDDIRPTCGARGVVENRVAEQHDMLHRRPMSLAALGQKR